MSHNTKWTIDRAHSEIEFKVRHLMIAGVKGRFTVFDASIYTMGKDFSTAQVDVWIESASLTTGNATRDEHLTGSNFLDVSNYPQISFVSSSIETSGDEGRHILWGSLTIKGVTRNVQMELQFGGIQNDPWGNQKAGFSVVAKINRSDWGLRWNTPIATGGVVVGEEVTIACELELIKADKDALVMNPALPEKSNAVAELRSSL